MSKKGFTLLEVLIVVIIIGILAAISLPQYISTIEKARSGEAVTNVGSLRTAIDRYWYQRGEITTNPDNLDIDNPNSVTNKLYSYSIADNGTTSSARAYTITATRTVSGITYTVTWVQTSNTTGKLYRSANLGGPVSP
ncbi:MAG: prepilin-type N-terminal cleavage/methylation domain-containing protein [Candidatus Omnitrophica bacterium]|nr:prepilin-type N-terminal cleavage/methylation domain-containing protein [Candidatus Omnitrophota bacterium]